MSQTRILCQVCGFPQVYCACGHSTDSPDTMDHPTPSPAPQWAKDAAEELVYPHGTPSRSVERRLENTSDHEDMAAKIGQIAAIITKHAAALSEENERLKREVEGCRRLLESERHRAEYALGALAACIFKAGGRVVIDDLAMAMMPNPRPDVYDQREEDRRARVLWIEMPQSHPAATNLTEEGKK